jgi:hypothetical protein
MRLLPERRQPLFCMVGQINFQKKASECYNLKIQKKISRTTQEIGPLIRLIGRCGQKGEAKMTDKELEKIYSEAYRAVYWTAMSLLKNEADMAVQYTAR